MLPFPNQKYSIIYADPPWSYKDKALSGNRGACCNYQVQSIEWIRDLTVASIADDNCALFLWVTMPQLDVCWDIIKAWGFIYKTVGFTWIKRNKKTNSWFWGLGSYTRANAELCLLATRGKLERKSKAVHSIVFSPIRQHSRKPDEVRDRIVMLFGDLPRIELFAREKVEGWDVWGLEV